MLVEQVYKVLFREERRYFQHERSYGQTEHSSGKDAVHGSKSTESLRLINLGHKSNFISHSELRRVLLQ
jgi:hypothetical protein